MFQASKNWFLAGRSDDFFGRWAHYVDDHKLPWYMDGVGLAGGRIPKAIGMPGAPSTSPWFLRKVLMMSPGRAMYAGKGLVPITIFEGGYYIYVIGAGFYYAWNTNP
jgi:hypothetical protein